MVNDDLWSADSSIYKSLSIQAIFIKWFLGSSFLQVADKIQYNLIKTVPFVSISFSVEVFDLKS
jgi:hypothetical protein